jgi:hypothetical protein
MSILFGLALLSISLVAFIISIPVSYIKLTGWYH